MEVFVGGGSSMSALAEANCWRWVDGKSIWKVLSKEAFGSVGGLSCKLVARRQLFVCAVKRIQASRINCSGCHGDRLWLDGESRRVVLRVARYVVQVRPSGTSLQRCLKPKSSARSSADLSHANQ
jgi:hypothetical protein